MESMTTEQQQLKSVISEFNDLSHHYFLKRYGMSPPCDEDKTCFLLHAIQTETLDERAKLERVISAMLLDAALTVHHHISLHSDRTSDGTYEQLTVLAGDLYSSMYYKRLAELADIPLIRLFSESTQTMNNAKVRLHAGDWHTAAELERLISDMEATLIAGLADFYQQQAIQQIVPYFLGLRKLKEMLHLLEQGTESWGSSLLAPLVSSRPTDRCADEEKYLLKKRLRETVVSQQTKLREALANFNSTIPSSLADRVQTVIDA
ncbi:heptaprenyl diphosphate synthase component 1 [Natribacillus halophilus]|uniref:Heptaprenyl diphosphate synthase (HEPPP synthase) subunit 1 n=1 Tax=Natribacillus halophilus TaxID=549003 RepID=A0A1G8JDG8_9BACI|nr:heptaprenyl diphosphate synthase component 1 [Natribacillus halophilus]SDI29017.1 Heptaprenyl diphosphate synthase (HEPPP synthase) subunit 1 [Natribacillus halophilus]